MKKNLRSLLCGLLALVLVCSCAGAAFAKDNGADGAILAAPLRDTLKRVDAGNPDATPRIAATEPRDGLWRALTPQAFRRDLLRRALERAQADGLVATDEAMAVERLGLRPALVEGREDNLKVTTPADLALAEFLLQGRAPR